MAIAAQIEVGRDYKEKHGFFDAESYVFKAKRGLSQAVVKELPIEYAVELNRLIQLEMIGSVG